MSEERDTRTRPGPEPGAGQSGGGLRPLSPESDAPKIGDWLHIDADGLITVYTGKVEVGQNIRTSLAHVVAEELCVSIDRVKLVMGDTDLTPFDPGTFGSRTSPNMTPHLCTVAASTRELLRELAARQWQVPREELSAADGLILHPASGRSAGYGALTKGQKIQEHYKEDAPITPPDRRTTANALRVGGRALVAGEHQYVTDLSVPGMLAGRVLRPPAFGATLRSVDTKAAEAMPDVLVVREGDFIGVVAPDASTAARAISAIRAEWHRNEEPSGEDLYSYLRTHPAEPPDGVPEPPVEDTGSLAVGRAGADLTLDATYTAAYIAHAPPEARAAVAEWSGERLTVWTGTQRPFGVRGELALAFDIPEERIRVIVPDTGAAYGGKHTGDAAVEAARLARAVRRPVKVVWTREEEFAQAYVRPAGVIDVASGVRSDGSLTAWELHNYNAGAAGIRTPYTVPNQQVAFHLTKSPLREGSYRALAATVNHFARETHMDELAHALGLDPLALRLRNIREIRLRVVLEAAASRFGWGVLPATDGRGVGIACGTEKNSYVATCAEVAVDQASNRITVVRVVQAFECGTIINPDAVLLQNEGAIIQGLGGALFEEVRFENGTIVSDRFSRYRVPRFADVPRIDVVLLDRRNLPSAGAGETPIVGVAPAVGNAIFNATGVRLRSLPLVSHGSGFVVSASSLSRDRESRLSPQVLGDRLIVNRIGKGCTMTAEEQLESREAVSLDELETLLRIPSISALPEHREDVHRAAEWVADRLQVAGMEGARVMPTGGHPVVYAEWQHRPERPTVLIYGHVDVQPVDPIDLWESPPFEPQVRDDRIYARGASDMKGNLLESILAVEALLRTEGSLPVNLKFLIEAQEEIGSPQLPEFVAVNRALLACDLVLSADGGQWSEEQPLLTLGLRGLAGLQIDVYGPASDLHSGIYGGMVANPIHALAHILDSMHDTDGRITVDGFYDDVLPMSDEERAAVAQVPFDAAEYSRAVGVEQLAGEAGYSPLERVWVRPTLEVNGIWGGFQGEGSKTVLPSEAHAKITCRLVPDQDPSRILESIAAHVERHTPTGIRAETLPLPGSGTPYVIPHDHWGNRATAEVLAELYGVQPYLTRSGGTVPVCAIFQSELNAYTVSFGFGLDDEQFHAPNEFLRLRSFRRGQIGWLRLLRRLGQEAVQQ